MRFRLPSASNRGKFELETRLNAHFAARPSSSLKERLKRSVSNWQIYTAVTGSAMAMVTGASAELIGGGEDINEPIASARSARQLASSGKIPLLKAVRQAMARQAASPQLGHAAQAAPTISTGGVVSLDGTMNTIEPGGLISIFGNNLANGTVTWNGDFPTSLGGTSVEINGKAAFLMFVSPGQINAQAPDDGSTGTVSVVVQTAGGSAQSTVTLNQFAPSFSLIDASHVCGIILRSNHSGAYGGGSYDILGPTGSSLGYPTVAAQPGDMVELFAVGFGPTTPSIPAGQAYSGAAPVNNPVTLYINNILVTPTFVGLSSAGLYQINLTVPTGLGQGDVSIQAIVGSMQTQAEVLFPLQLGGTGPVYSSSGGLGIGVGGSFGSGGFGSGGTGGSFRKPHAKKPYEPKLQFDPK
jgi:uncharacterized protein (TIGR03437 family)